MERIYGLLGRKLGHSWSAPIHASLGCENYRLIELEPEELASFLPRIKGLETEYSSSFIIHSISKSQCLYPAAELQIRSLFTNFIPWASVPLYFFFSYLVCLSNPPTNLIFWFYIFSQFSTKTSVKGLNNAKLGDQTKQ